MKILNLIMKAYLTQVVIHFQK